MIRDGGEIEDTLDLCHPFDTVDRAKRQRLAFSKSVGVVGGLETAAALRIQGDRGVRMEIAEQRLAQRLVLRARFARRN